MAGAPTKLRNLKLERIDLVDNPANPGARVVLHKRAIGKDAPATGQVHVDRPDWLVKEAEVHMKAEHTSGERTALPDSAFAAVWSDAEGHVQRKLPYRRADGSIDRPHLRNALARLSQTDMPSSVRGTARRKLEAAAKESNVGKSTLKKFLARIFKEAEAVDPDALRQWAEEEAGEDAHQDEEKEAGAGMSALKAFHEKLGSVIGTYGDGAGLPADHPLHALKALHKEMGDHLTKCSKEAEAEAEAIKARKEAEAEAEADAALGPIRKSNAAISKAFVKLEKAVEAANARAEAAEKIAKSEREARAVEIQKAALRKYSGVPVNPDTDAAMLHTLAESHPEIAKRVTEILNGADEAIKKGRLFDEVGSPRVGDAGSDTAWALIEAEAEKVIQKSSTKLTKEQAIDAVMKSRPDLVKQYRATAQ